jgi:hypothetical protein
MAALILDLRVPVRVARYHLQLVDEYLGAQDADEGEIAQDLVLRLRLCVELLGIEVGRRWTWVIRARVSNQSALVPARLAFVGLHVWQEENIHGATTIGFTDESRRN